MLQPPLEHIAEESPRIDDELLAERIEVAGHAWLVHGSIPTISQMLAKVPVLRSRPIAFDAALDIVLRGLLGQGLSLEDAIDRIREDAPGFEDAIEAHVALRSLVSGWSGTRTASTPDPTALPRPFGPTLDDGKRRYELVELIGSGCEGSVFRAFDRRLSADGRPLPVAVKLLHHADGNGGWAVEQESARVMRVRHPAIAALLDCGRCEDQSYLVYEFIEGLSLDRWRRRRGGVIPREAARAVARLAGATQSAHNVGVVHRDLKPTNVLMDAREEPYITDFGLAAASERAHSEGPAGSLGFAAPEQLRGRPDGAETTVDTYALGGILYWLLTGKYPNGHSAAEIQESLREEWRPTLNDLDQISGCDATLRGIVRRALSTEIAHRYSSAALLETDLKHWLQHEPVLPYDRGAARRVRLAVRRSPLSASVTAVAGLVVVAAVVLAWNRETARRSAEFERQKEQLAKQRDVALAEARAEFEEQKSAEAGRFIRALQARMLQDKDAHEATSVLPVLHALELVVGPEGLNRPELLANVASDRIRILRSALEESEKNGTSDAVIEVLWESSLGFWLIQAGRFAEAREVMEQNVLRVAKVFGPSDPWNLSSKLLHQLAIATSPDCTPEQAATARSHLSEIKGEVPASLREFAERVLARQMLESSDVSADATGD